MAAMSSDRRQGLRTILVTKERFEQSAHNLPFEEPTRFDTVVGSELAAITAAPVTTSCD
jgi:hypothetical protein